MDLLEQSFVTGLSDLAAPVFAMAIQLRESNDPGSLDQLRQRIDDALATFDRRALRESVDSDEIELARFALVAFLDEIVLRSNWPIREAWASRPLQMQYFDEVNAGVIFFEKIDALRGKSAKSKLDVLEIYLTALGLGFRGRHSDMEGASRVRSLMRDLTEEIEQGRGKKSDRALAPEPAVATHLPERVREFPPWIVAAISAGVVFLLYFVLWIFLSGQASRELADL